MPHAESPSRSTLSEQFFVNDGALDADQIGYLRPTTLDSPIEQVRQRFATDGYVLLKGLIPAADVLTARSKYFTFMAPSGVLAPETDPADGIFNPSANPQDYPGIGAGSALRSPTGRPTGPNPAIADQFVELAMQAHYEPWYRDVFCRHPALHEYIARFTGWGMENTLPIRRTVLRNNTPGNNAIGVHYDQIFLRHGEDTSVTAWVPIGDIDLRGGGLIYLEKGHELGKEIEAEFTAKAQAAGMSDIEMKNAFNQNMLKGGVLTQGAKEFARRNGGRRWLITEYEAGDVVLHNAYAIHASLLNRDPKGKIRLGTDLRFVDSRQEWNRRWDQSFAFGDGV